MSKETDKLELSYPCTWTYTVIGQDCSLLKDAITRICSPLKTQITHSNTSSKGKYFSLKAELIVPDEKTRLEIFDKLKDSPIIKIVL